MNLRKGQLIRIDWDDPERGSSSFDGSYHGEAKFLKKVNKGELGDELLKNGPHVIVKCSGDDQGSFFPLTAVSLKVNDQSLTRSPNTK